ncbi:MAG: type transport system permease protein [Chloroflexota bacterium]|nr:type transport system permease protein [Chloroflexota bacterium]
MKNFLNMLWVESLKTRKSRIPWMVGLGFMILPLMCAFLFFIYKNPSLSQQLGIVGAKANLMVGEVSWAAYFKIIKEAFAIGGYLIVCLMLAWVFGREFMDHTVKDILAVPVPRGHILAAKLLVVAAWYSLVFAIFYPLCLLMGNLIDLPGFTTALLQQESLNLLLIAALNLLVTLPFAYLASLGRGIMLPIGLAILILVIDNLIAVIGYGDYFPWAIPGMLSQGETLSTASLIIVLATALAGLLATYAWWMTADQSR